mmetsp:Transcript_48361/g.154455  ORF Transcript_48361/g.154455 Transcript_48361/m.154455 type:complete len:211 (-) Transcript_48361:569-1201(-)
MASAMRSTRPWTSRSWWMGSCPAASRAHGCSAAPARSSGSCSSSCAGCLAPSSPLRTTGMSPLTTYWWTSRRAQRGRTSRSSTSASRSALAPGPGSGATRTLLEIRGTGRPRRGWPSLSVSSTWPPTPTQGSSSSTSRAWTTSAWGSWGWRRSSRSGTRGRRTRGSTPACWRCGRPGRSTGPWSSACSRCSTRRAPRKCASTSRRRRRRA